MDDVIARCVLEAVLTAGRNATILWLMKYLHERFSVRIFFQHLLNNCQRIVWCAVIYEDVFYAVQGLSEQCLATSGYVLLCLRQVLLLKL